MSEVGGQDPSWNRWRRPKPTAAQQRNDVWIMLAVLAGAVVATVLINSMGAFVFDNTPSLVEQFAWAAAVTLPLVVRRRFPLPVLIAVGVLFVMTQVRQIGDTLVPSIALFLAIYTSGAWEHNRTVARWSRVIVIVGMFCWLGYGLLDFLVDPGPGFEGAAGPLDPVLASVLYNIGFNLLFFLSAYFFGNLAWLSARRQAELEQRAEQLRFSQEQNMQGAVVAERVRIARDLHDVVAHHVSVMGVQAGAARRVFDRDRELALSALRTVESTARTAIGELRGLLGVLRAEQGERDGADKRPDESHPASPGLAQVPDLVPVAESAGLDVRLGVFGDPLPVPEGIALSAYRIVQEALTNVVKHATARKVDLRIRYLDSAVEVEITDDGRGRAAAAPRLPGSGFGLLGMRERVAVHDGELEVGPRPDGGYRVRASFPVRNDDQSTSDSREIPAT
ncbi:histidine kinase [Prauserella marina]|uniref:histidine kinase n=1 Tax=Prauserella marina TaxID=530584 RepID=A0A222VQ90_9PSEU|nr:sensor histidine kinase [Prauserella marina]ASR36085.1 histidine kinase [Prauserella marina]PWV76814.1 signal transduction histidine kinase [Prauserella marina]SDC98181.1 Signal transduction histidine kinase [Prauserella marina]